MKKNYILLVVIFLLYGARPVKADHTSGIDFTYKCLGGLTYELTLDFYRDCSGTQGMGCCGITLNNNCTNIGGMACSAGTGAPAYFTYYSLSCNYCKRDTFPLYNMVTTDVTPVCAGQKTTCNGGTLSGFQRYRYKRIITLPSQCTDWTFLFVGWSRNNITTVSNSLSDQDVIMGTLNNVAAPGNSSPSFATPNVTYLCSGQSYCYNHHTIESDGDSLVYSLSQPIGNVSPQQYVVYNAGYAYTSPFGAGSPITLNTSDGSICVTPSTQLVTLMDVTVSEYRNGVKIGSVTRDMEFIITASCTNNSLPVSSGKGGAAYSGSTDSVHACVGTQLCFTINGSDPNAGDTVNMSWDNSIPGASFNVNNNNSFNPSGQFCWTPAIADTAASPHVFVVTVIDNACIYRGVQYFPFYVYVNSCGSVIPPPASALAANDSNICENECINFADHSTGNPTSWLWTFAGGLPPTSTNQNPQQVCYISAGNYNVTLLATNGGGSNSVTLNNLIHVITSPPVPVITQNGNTLTCSTDPSYISYQWYDSTALIPGATGTSVVITHSGNYNVQVTNSNNCKTAVGINVTVGLSEFDNNAFGFSLRPNPVGDELTVSGNWKPEIRNWKLEIYNVLGEKIRSAFLTFDGSRGGVVIDVSSLAKGVYIVQLQAANDVYRAGMVKR